MSPRGPLAVVALIAGLVGPVLLVPALGSAAARQPRPPAGVAIPALPAPRADAKPLPAGLPETLPIIAVDASAGTTASSISMAAGDDAAALFFGAWSALRFESVAEFPEAAGQFTLEQSDGFEAGQVTPRFAAELDQIVDALKAHPENAAAINNVAVGLFVLGNFPDGERSGEFAAGREPFGQGEALMATAIALLNRATATFDDRALVMNAAFLTDIRTDEDPTPALASFVARHPDDAGARLLLASLQSRHDRRGGLDAAVATIAPLRHDPALATIADLAEGDALVASADSHLGASPFLVHQRALAAVDRFDRVIEESGDWSAYAGRAAALDLLGATADALAAQQVASRLGATTIASELRIAELKECLGDQIGRRESAHAALGLLRSEPLTLDRVRLLTPDPKRTDRGYLGVSVGSERRGLPTYLEGRGAAGFIFTAEPERPADPCIVPSSSPAEDALGHGVAASAALHDAAGIEAAVGDFLAATYRLPLDQGMVSAARMALGVEIAPDAGPGSAVLDLVPDLAPAEGAALCRAVRESDPSADRQALIACEARGASQAALAAGDPLGAQRALEDGFAAQDAAGLPADAILLLEAGSRAEGLEDLDGARVLYQRAAAFEATSAAAFSRLSQLAFKRSDHASALTLLHLALAATDRARGDPEHADADVVRTRAYLLSNRGATRLELARSEPGAAPDCARLPVACVLAGADFDEALQSDPANWVYLLNSAWVARLTGRTAEAHALLEQTLAIAPETVPALIDLGVLEARAGDGTAARGRFLEALAIEPDNDLARWDLGVLESADGPAAWPAGQRDLAAAVGQAPSLKLAPIAYRTDEHVYAVDVRGGTTFRLGQRGSTPGAIVAVAAASIAVVGSFGSVTEAMRDSFVELVRFAAARIEKLLGGPSSVGRKTLRRRLPVRAVAGLGWAAYLIVLAATTWIGAGSAWPDAPPSGIALATLATLIAVGCHVMGHVIGAAVHDIEFHPARWRGGIVVGLVGLVLQLPSGPYPGERLSVRTATASAPVSTDDTTGPPRAPRPATSALLWRVSLWGPIVNILGAAIALGAYLILPIPFLRLLVVTHLTVAGFSLIAAQALDGSRLGDRRPWVGALLALAIAGAAASISAGLV